MAFGTEKALQWINSSICVHVTGGCDSVSPDPSVAKFVPSPKPNKSYAFVRGPPDGCEKIEIDESRFVYINFILIKDLHILIELLGPSHNDLLDLCNCSIYTLT